MSSQTPNASVGTHVIEIDCKARTTVDKKNKSLIVFPQFKLRALAANTATKEADLTIEATFAVIYKAKSLAGLNKENYDAFGKTNGIYNAWPYWREFAQALRDWPAIRQAAASVAQDFLMQDD